MRISAALASLALFAVSHASAQVNTNGGANAIGGYDAVAYFTDHAAVAGTADHAFDWHGAHWLFASEEHRALFAANPAHYAPAYGGYCAFAAADNRLARVDPQAWSVEGGRLFLNYSLEIRRQWLADRARFIQQADAHWPELSRQAH
jgi:YHS domain-containing protein